MSGKLIVALMLDPMYRYSLGQKVSLVDAA